MAVPSYRERLRREGLALAGVGAAGSAALIVLVPASRRWPLNTVGQLAVTAALLQRFGTRSVRKAMDGAREALPGGEGTGEATPLWMMAPIVAGLATPFVLLPRTGLPGSSRAGWDAALRITAGSMLSGLAQATLYERAVAADERVRARRYVRATGSSLLGSTNLVFTPVG